MGSDRQEETVFPPNNSLARRFGLTLVAVVSAILILFSGVVGWYNHGRKEAELHNQLDQALKLAETSLPEAVWQVDDRSINDILRAILANDAVVYAKVLVDGEIVASQARPGQEGKDITSFRDRSSFLVSSAEIRRNGYLVGRLQVVMSRDAIYRELLSTTFSIIGLLFALIVAILFTSMVILRYYIFRPLAILEKSAKRIAAGNLDTPIDFDANDEIGSLALALGVMTRRLKESFDDLEQKVRERTADLSRAKITAEETRDHLSVVGAELQALLDNSPVGIVFVDNHGVILRINQEMEKITGYRPAELVGKTARQFYATGEAYEAIIEKVRPVLKSIGYCERQSALQRKDGGEIICQLRGRLVPAEGGLRGVVWSVEAISGRIRMESELLKTKKQESINVLAGGIAHDFNNILFAVIGNISLAERLAEAGSPVQEHLRAAQKAAVRAKELTEKLLTFASGAELVKATASLPDLVRDAAGFVLSGSNVKCRFEVPDDLWTVSMDKQQITQVIETLVRNGAQAMPGGGTITVGFANSELVDGQVAGLNPGKYVKVSLIERGRGITDQNLDKVFDPYVSTKERDSSQGAGLGLAIVHSIISKHEGKITVDSHPGQGTTFTLYLPALSVEGPAITVRSPILPSGKGTVLVMDDDRDVHEVVCEMLMHMGYKTISAHDGKEAIQLYRQARQTGDPPVAAIMDLTIPGGMGGVEAVTGLLAVDPEAKVIATSGYSNDPVFLKYRDYGFAGAICKPYQLLELIRVMAAVTGK